MILVDIVEELEPAAEAVDVDVDVIDFDSPTSWVRAVGHATVPMAPGRRRSRSRWSPSSAPPSTR